MPYRHPLLKQLATRLIIAIVLSGLLTCVVAAWVYITANRQAASIQLNSAHEHYARVISNLEQHWGREAFDFKVRLESQHYLQNPKQNTDALMVSLTSQGGSVEFPSLRVEDARGNQIALFEYVGHKLPKVKFLPGQETTWATDPVHGQLFMVFRQFIWLGTENGYLYLFKPMDHALLNQYSYPFTRISLWWKGKPVASSEGEEGLPLAAAVFEKSGKNGTPAMLPWSDANPDNAPLLFIESTSPPLLTISELAIPLILSLILFLAASWLLLGAWGKRALLRIQFLETHQNDVPATLADAQETRDSKQ